MRLKSIKLAGFKSFVDATTVSLPNNMTAIVGPNGCGKSNVIDAVRWVMGESSAKNLRGESMTDVIFNGSSVRQPVGQASIELIFDNSAGKLSGEYAGFSEISVKRKVTREGLSQYYLNGSKCRRRDVTDLFLGTGMGPRSYAIIEQGMISKLIESKPEELRVYLEEAAGISKYKERRRDTENRIARTQENLDRLTDIREELGKQLAHLQRQAKAAERFREYKKEERICHAKLQAIQWQELDASKQQMERTLAERENQIEKAVLERTEKESEIERNRLEHEARQEEFSRIQGKFYEIGSEIAKLEQDIRYRKERIEQQVSSKARLAMEKANITERIRETEQELIEKKDDAEILVPELGLQQERLEESRAALEEKEEEQKHWQQAWEIFDQRYRDNARIRDKAEATIERLVSGCEEKSNRILVLKQEREELSGLIDNEEFHLLAAQLDELEQEIEDKQQQLEAMSRARSESLEKQKVLRRVREDQVSELNKKEAIHASLVSLQSQATAQHADEDGTLLQEAGLDVNARIFSDMKIAEGWDLAVEHVLGPGLHAIATDDLVLPNAVLEQLATGICLANPDCQSISPKPDTLSSVVEGAAPFVAMFNQIHTAPDGEAAKGLLEQLPDGATVITPDGTWMSRHWTRYFKPEPERTGIVKREVQIRELELVLTEAKERIAVAEVELQTLESALEDVEKRTSDLAGDVRTLEAEHARISSMKSAHEARTEQRTLRMDKNRTELDSVQAQLEREQEALRQEEAVLEEVLNELDSTTLERESRLEQREAIRSALEHHSRELRRVQGEVHALELAQQEKHSKRNLLELSLRRLREDEQRVEQAFSELGSVEEDEEAVEFAGAQLEGLLESRIAIEERMGQSRVELERIAEHVRQCEHRRQQCENDVVALRESLNELRLEKQALEMRQRACIEKIEEQDFELQTVLDNLDDQDQAKILSERLETLATRIQRLGAINLAALDEFKEQSERKEYLDAQHEELTSALDMLLEAIRKIDRETRARFRETYDQVNEGLQRLFPKIFGGGSASLELTDDDLLETGVAIIARPPGKKNSTIHLLSGGEKALTAIALIFAIFELNPAPFCMLDEVDAPLDDANVGRFAAMVKEMSERVQFIYITHNKVSMEKADQLMGVTMSEPGVSRLVSVDVDEAAALAEA